MGLIDIFRRQPDTTKAVLPAPSPVTDEVWEEVTVRKVESLVARFRNWNESKILARYGRNLALDAAMFNAKNLAAVPLRLYKKGGTGGKRATKDRMRHLTDPHAVGVKAAMMAESAGDVVEIQTSPPLSMLRRPDSRTTGMAWDVARWVDKQLYGEALLLATKGGSLIRLMPQFCNVQPDDDGLIAGWYYGRDSIALAEYEAESVLQMKWAEHPSNPYRGLGWLDLAIREIEIDDHALASELTRWQNGGYPEGVMSFGGRLTRDQFKEAIEQFKIAVRSKLKLLVTGEGSYTPLSVPKDMQYREGLEIAERRILNRAGIPESLYRLNDANLASSTTGHEAYAKYTLAPALAVDAEQWTELLLPRFGLDPDVYFFAYDEVSQKDMAQTVQSAVSLVGARVWTRNEARAELGYPPVDGGDAFEQPQSPSAGFGFSPTLSLSQSLPTLGAGPQADATPVLAGAPAPKSLTIKSWGDPDPWACCGHDHATKADDRLSKEQINAFERAMREYFKLVGSQLTIQAIESGTVNLSGLNAPLADALEPLIGDAFRAGAVSGYSQIGRDADLFDVAPEEALRIVRERGNLVADLVGSTTEEAVRSAIRQGVEEQLSAREVQRLVREALVDAAPHRAEAIARTEVANAQGAGATAAWKEAGVEQRRWLLAPDACSICLALVDKLGREGRESASVAIDQPFLKSGETLVGVDGRRFTAAFDIYHEPLHPNDRCTTVAVLPEVTNG